MKRRLVCYALAVVLSSSGQPSNAQEPTGLAASALGNPAFTWLRRSVPGFRVYILADSYPARYQDSLLARLPSAARHAEAMLQIEPLAQPIDLFFIESREQMTQLIGARATGFAQPSARAVFLVTNPTWRAFERHEIMHVIAGQAWGRPGPNTDWLVEGLAQAADGRCGSFTNADVLLALATRRGWIPFPTVLTEFRNQPDLRAYLQAAAFVDQLLGRFGPTPLKELWTRGAAVDSVLGGMTLMAIEEEWRAELRETARLSDGELAAIETKGCG
ncbi:MAG TPA: hypothetical protein VGA78_05495 [Gemmatimonadales bacterium]|jgi:hypothetical protein